MSGKAARILLTEKHQDILQKITQAATVSQRLIQRASVILLAFSALLSDHKNSGLLDNTLDVVTG